MFVRVFCPPFSSHGGWSPPRVLAAAPSSLGGGRADAETRHGEVLPLWILGLLGLVRAGAGLRPQRMDFCSQMELSRRVWDETWDTQGRSFVFTSINLATIAHVLLGVGPPRCFPCDSMEDSHFHWQHRGQVLAQGLAAHDQDPFAFKGLLPLPPHRSTRGTSPWGSFQALVNL